MNMARSNFAVVSQNGIIYALGGRDKANSSLKTIEAFSASTDSWKTNEISLLLPRSEFGNSLLVSICKMI
jgi:hypothetical protein